jgi:hypothetical protein
VKSDYQKNKIVKTTRNRISRQINDSYKEDLEFKRNFRNKKVKNHKSILK